LTSQTKFMSCSTIERLDSKKVRFSESIETFETHSFEGLYDSSDLYLNPIGPLQASQLVHDLQKYARVVFHRVLFSPNELSVYCRRLCECPRRHSSLWFTESKWKYKTVKKILDIQTNTMAHPHILSQEELILSILI
jgi:hypothetical protein